MSRTLCFLLLAVVQVFRSVRRVDGYDETANDYYGKPANFYERYALVSENQEVDPDVESVTRGHGYRPNYWRQQRGSGGFGWSRRPRIQWCECRCPSRGDFPGFPGPMRPGFPSMPPGNPLQPGQTPPGQFPPGQFPQGQTPQGQTPPGEILPGQVPPGQLSPGNFTQIDPRRPIDNPPIDAERLIQ